MLYSIALALIPQTYTGYVTLAVSLCALFVAAAPAPLAGSPTWYGKGYAGLWHVIDFIALNFRNGTTTAADIKAGRVVPTSLAGTATIIQTVAADLARPAVPMQPTAAAILVRDNPFTPSANDGR